MSLCKNCLHKEICDHPVLKMSAELSGHCKHFIDATLHCELPVFIGQKVWIPFFWSDGRMEIEEGKVSGLQQKADKSWKVRITSRGTVADYSIDEFNKRIFLTEGAANEYVYERYNR